MSIKHLLVPDTALGAEHRVGQNTHLPFRWRKDTRDIIIYVDVVNANIEIRARQKRKLQLCLEMLRKASGEVTEELTLKS